MRKFPFNGSQTFAFIGMLLIFILDFFLPLGLSVSLLYLICFLMIIRETKRTILFFFVLASFLIVLDLVIIYRVDIGWKEFLDVGMSILAIGVGAAMSIRHRTLLEKTNAERAAYVKSLEEMLFLTSHKVRKPVATCMGLMNVFNMENPEKEDLKVIFGHLKSSATDLDLFTRELTTFIGEIESKHRTEQ
jgi:hypothetical protein